MTTQAYSALRRPGWLTFAAVVMFSVGVLRAITALYYFADSARVNNLTGGAFGTHVFLWGIWDLAIAVLAIWAGYSLLNGNMFGRIVAYFWAGLVLIQGFLILASAPWFGFGAILLAILVMYAISVSANYGAE
jgi:hypothetical protein